MRLFEFILETERTFNMFIAFVNQHACSYLSEDANLFTEPEIVDITNAPTTDAPTTIAPTPQLSNATLQSESIKAVVVENEKSCTTDPCDIKSWCRSSHGTCGPGRLYCNTRSSWTLLCPSVAPTGSPTSAPTLKPTTAQPTTPKPTATITESSDRNFSLEDSFEIPDGVEGEENFLPGVYNTKDTEADDETNSGFPIAGYVAIALLVAVVAGLPVALYMNQRNNQHDPLPSNEVNLEEDHVMGVEELS